MEERVLYPELESEEAFREFMNETPSMKNPKVNDSKEDIETENRLFTY